MVSHVRCGHVYPQIHALYRRCSARARAHALAHMSAYTRINVAAADGARECVRCIGRTDVHDLGRASSTHARNHEAAGGRDRDRGRDHVLAQLHDVVVARHHSDELGEIEDACKFEVDLLYVVLDDDSAGVDVFFHQAQADILTFLGAK